MVDDATDGFRPEDKPTIQQLLKVRPSRERVERMKPYFKLDDPSAPEEARDWMAAIEARRFNIAYNLIIGGQSLDDDVIDGMLLDLIDVHVHGGSDPFPRAMLEDDIGIHFTQAGARAIVVKTWHTPSASRTALVQRRINHYADTHGLRPTTYFGGITIGNAIGGFNPYAIKAALGFPGMKFVWFPMVDSAHHRRIIFDDWSGAGLHFLDEKSSKVIEPVKEILRIIADNDLVLATGHYSYEDSARLIDEAVALGVRNISVVHPSMVHCRHTIEEMKEQAARGAKLELQTMSVVALPGDLHPIYVTEMINEVGAENFVLGSDWGQADNIPHLVGVRWAIKKMLRYGVTPEQIRTIYRDAPAKLLGLPPSDGQPVPHLARAGSGLPYEAGSAGAVALEANRLASARQDGPSSSGRYGGESNCC